MYFAHTFSTGTLGVAQLRSGTLPRRGTTKFVIRASSSTRNCVILPEFEEKILHVISHFYDCLRKDENFLSLRISTKVKNLCMRRNLRVRKKN